jgi:hypothetical protein
MCSTIANIRYTRHLTRLTRAERSLKDNFHFTSFSSRESALVGAADLLVAAGRRGRQSRTIILTMNLRVEFHLLKRVKIFQFLRKYTSLPKDARSYVQSARSNAAPLMVYTQSRSELYLYTLWKQWLRDKFGCPSPLWSNH